MSGRTTKAEVRSLARELREVARSLDWAVRAGNDEWPAEVVDITMHWSVPSSGTLGDAVAEEYGIEY